MTGSDESSGVRRIDTGGTGEEGWDESSGVRCIETGRAGVEGWGETAGGYSSRDGNLDAAVLDGYDAAPGCVGCESSHRDLKNNILARVSASAAFSSRFVIRLIRALRLVALMSDPVWGVACPTMVGREMGGKAG